ncbi:MAG: secondary thiamine-phosphate synthase enzyme YjbQ [Wenzhouxiangella sp.]|jgi:secondary thiamine-phosphate synthase enzyme|nr:secondary thiamine-phosphate synthase enzyme YjbQ [Wenzhouxiangella sp.]
MHRETVEIRSAGRGFQDVTEQISGVIDRSNIRDGLCHVFIQHTSAGLLIAENADPDVLVDLETWMSAAVKDGDPRFRHRAEGPDDMSAHIRTLLTETALTIPVQAGRLALGTWQGIFVWEHRTHPHSRRLMVSVT